MRKKIIAIACLLILIGLSIRYLSNIDSDSLPFKYQNRHKPLIIQKDDIKLYEISDFNVDDSFTFLSLDDISYKYSFDDSNLNILVSNEHSSNSRSYPYRIMEKEKEIVEVIKEVHIKDYPDEPEKPVYEDTYDAKQEQDFFYGYHDVSVEKDTDMDTLVSLLSKDIVSSRQVTIDYVNVNLSVPGTYPVYYFVNNETYEIKVTVF